VIAFLALWWPELTGLAIVLAASLWLNWAMSSNVLPSLLLGVPFGCGVGGAVAAWRRR